MTPQTAKRLLKLRSANGCAAAALSSHVFIRVSVRFLKKFMADCYIFTSACGAGYCFFNGQAWQFQKSLASLQSQTGIALGRLAQLVQSICLTSRGSLVRTQYLPLLINSHLDSFLSGCFAFGLNVGLNKSFLTSGKQLDEHYFCRYGIQRPNQAPYGADTNYTGRYGGRAATCPNTFTSFIGIHY